MGADEKLLAKLSGKKIPNDITMNELNRFLLNMGFSLHSQVSAHYNFKHPGLEYIITIDSHDFRRDVNPIYVRKVIDALEELGLKGEPK